MFNNWPLKGQCREIFDLFFGLTILAPIWTGKNGFTNFFVFAKIFVKDVCLHSQQLYGHCISVVKDTREIISLGKSKKQTKSNKNYNEIFFKIACWYSHWLRWHCVSVVVDYTVMFYNNRLIVDYADTMSA